MADSKPLPSSTLSIWRTLPPTAISQGALSSVRQEVAHLIEIGGPTWAGAGTGNAAAAITLALGAMRRRETQPPHFDVLMSAVLICAANGNSAAGLVLAHALRRAGNPLCSAPL